MSVRSGIVSLRSATLPLRSGIYLGSNAILVFNFILPGLTGTIMAHKFMQSASSGGQATWQCSIPHWRYTKPHWQ